MSHERRGCPSCGTWFDTIPRLTQAFAEAEAALEKIAEAKIGMAAGNIYFTSDQSVLQQCKIIAAQALSTIRDGK